MTRSSALVFDVEDGGQAGRHGLEEPDVDDRRGQGDVAHALAADARVRDLDAATVADDSLVLHAAVLAAEALPVALRTEDAFAEQPVLLRAIGAIVDRLRLLHFAVGPAPDVLRRRQRNPDGSEIVDPLKGRVDHCGHLLSSAVAEVTPSVTGRYLTTSTRLCGAVARRTRAQTMATCYSELPSRAIIT